MSINGQMKVDMTGQFIRLWTILAIITDKPVFWILLFIEVVFGLVLSYFEIKGLKKGG